MKIGVLALQGDFIEHIKILQILGAEAVEVRQAVDLDAIDGLIIPGGESTTFRKLADKYKLMKPLKEFTSYKPVWGTCAGMIFLARDIGPDGHHLGMMDIVVERNAFGRQVNSFEVDLTVPVLSNGRRQPFKAIFIRAPRIVSVDEKAGVQILATLDDGTIVAARQKRMLATAFHPELTADHRFHSFFLTIFNDPHEESPAS